MNRSLPRLACLQLALLSACTRGAVPSDPPDAPASPQAKAVPAQLANVPPIAPSGPIPASLDAGPPPAPLRSDRPVPADALGAKDLTGYSIHAILRQADPPPGSKAPEVNQAALEAARKKTEARITIDLTATRTRMVLAAGFVLPEETELRARVDRYGFLVLEPSGSVYRAAAPGSLRALLGERRLDVAPLSPADVATRGEGPRRLGYRTRKVELVTRAANASIEIARLADAGDGGTLVCRALLDLVNAPPSTPLCGWEDIPLHAELRWTAHGALHFDVVSLARRSDLSPALLAAPPPAASFESAPLPPSPGEPLLSNADLAGFRTQPIDVGDAGADPAGGLNLINATDELRVVWIDGVPAAWVSPGALVVLPSLVRGRYAIAWRTFLGDVASGPEMVVAPGTSRVGEVDGGR